MSRRFDWSGIRWLVGIMTMIICTYALWSVRHAGGECRFDLPNGSIESTGLYGNCSYMNGKLNVRMVNPAASANWTHMLDIDGGVVARNYTMEYTEET
jgi:hypothetical protein